ncbi:helicase associated domain-containing protein [Streptomyces sp. RP5T]|uniref:helicase associated domain-containing protein n=1 Tax=Streptomyces sp. RP5T TaxID=2490848 RepID=UPI0021AD8003|nr:helicase associated domain-containing protein [Streptomyces sp. RP5T]
MGGHPLGVFIADQRRYYREGTLDARRVAELENLGMVWSVHASAWEAGLDVARDYAAVHGHFLPPTTAVWGGDGFPIGVWAKNMRAAARRSRENAVRRANGETGISSVGELSESRMETLAEIDPGWAPEGWDIAWQRCYRLTRAHVQAGGVLPDRAGEVIVQGEDLGVWVAGQRTGWDRLVSAQQYLLETIGLEPAGEGEAVGPVRRSQDDRWAANLAAVRQFREREGHVLVPRKAIEHVDEVPHKIGAFLDNCRRRVGGMSAERRAELAALGFEWAVLEGRDAGC